ncbi:MAG: hypothetical protein V3U65_18920 [Granulosicoccaceae bacterium]
MAATIIRLRLERAADQLANSHTPAKEIAADAPNVEIYINNPKEVAPTKLITQLCLPL